MDVNRFSHFYRSSDFSLGPLFGKEGPGEILTITNTTVFFQEHPVTQHISF
jgi:hypothetical protein